jgi:hypothetical protein
MREENVTLQKDNGTCDMNKIFAPRAAGAVTCVNHNHIASHSAATSFVTGRRFRLHAINWQQWVLSPMWLIGILVIITIFHSHQFAFQFGPNTECTGGTCLIQFLTETQLQVRQSRIVTYDEFFHRGPSQEEIHQFFHYDIALYRDTFYSNNSDTYFQLHPIWQGRTTTNTAIATDNQESTHHDSHNKLIFLHTSRTVGSIIRALLRAYSLKRNRTLLSINRCMDLNYEFMEDDDIWRNGRYSRTNTAYMDCMATLYNGSSDDAPTVATVNDSTSQDGDRIQNNPNQAIQISSSYLFEHSIDILSGNVPLGCDEYWFNNNAEYPVPTARTQPRPRVNTRYVVFFRHPMNQFVSEFVVRTAKGQSNNDTRSVNDLVEQLSSHALITPKQMAWVERQSYMMWSQERRVNVTMMNLLQNTNQLFIALVERMPESLSVLQYLIDPNNQSSSIFQFFFFGIKASAWSNEASINRTNAIVGRIQSDIVLRSMVEEYIKYETQIYSLAVQIHDRQYRWFQQYVDHREHII